MLLLVYVDALWISFRKKLLEIIYLVGRTKDSATFRTLHVYHLNPSFHPTALRNPWTQDCLLLEVIFFTPTVSYIL
jgi:hypothetical protein